ncbi:glycosyltransferase family 4 protein [Candidatus Woesearchaeota archaeon]|jgi:glycosyltransferase involved in cell wall biosynthesis|nr:glycosyltransferase family 4 protein [Candidatus Woesearchaeota archaeon]
MKIYFDADVEERKYEGRSQTSILMKKFLESKGFTFVDHPRKADLIQFHSSGIFASFRAAKWKKKYKVPVIYTLYSLSKTEPFNHIRNHFAQRYYLRKRKTSFLLSYSAILPLKWRGYNLKKLDLIITPSIFVKKRLFENTKLIRIGIDTKKFRPLKINKQKDEKMRVGYFGHPSAYKGVLDFARASKKFSKDYQSYIFISDTSKKMLRNLKEINPKLNIYGHTKNITKAYNDMDIIVLPYRSHLAGVANPLVLIEAMACGKAIVTTNFSYLKEIVKDSALLIKPYSPKSIVKAVKKLKNEKLRELLGKKAKEIIEKEYGQEKMFNEYLKVYRFFENKMNKN